MAKKAPHRRAGVTSNFTYADARGALSDWIEDHRERFGTTGVMWDPDTDEVTGASITGYAPQPKMDALASAIRSGVTVHERTIEAAVAEYAQGGPPPPVEVVEFLARRGRGVGQARSGAPRVQSQVNQEAHTRDMVQTVRWYYVHKVGCDRNQANKLAIDWVAAELGLDTRTVKKHSRI